MTTPEPVSSAPDTDDFPLRQQLAKTLNRARLDVAANDNLVIDLVKALNELVSLVAEREAGLRADLDRARADAERLSLEIQGYQVDGPYQRGHEHGQQARQAEVDQARAEVARLTAVCDRTHEALRGLLPMPGVVGSLDDVPISHLVVRLARQVARVSGTRTIPDDAAVDRVALWLLRAKYGDMKGNEATARRHWDVLFDDLDRDAWRHYARALLADLGATSTTDPAPALSARPTHIVGEGERPGQLLGGDGGGPPANASLTGPAPAAARELLADACRLLVDLLDQAPADVHQRFDTQVSAITAQLELHQPVDIRTEYAVRVTTGAGVTCEVGVTRSLGDARHHAEGEHDLGGHVVERTVTTTAWTPVAAEDRQS